MTVRLPISCVVNGEAVERLVEPRVTLAGIDGVMAAKPVFADRAVVTGWVARLAQAAAQEDRAAAEAVFEEAVPDFRQRGHQGAGPSLSRAEAVPSVDA